jgi:hypothetical protein
MGSNGAKGNKVPCPLSVVLTFKIFRGSYVLDLTFLRETTSLNVTLSPSSSLKVTKPAARSFSICSIIINTVFRIINDLQLL